jgi:hypothetical protein
LDEKETTFVTFCFTDNDLLDEELAFFILWEIVRWSSSSAFSSALTVTCFVVDASESFGFLAKDWFEEPYYP